MTNVDFGRREMFKFLVAYFFYSDTYSTVASVGILVIQQVKRIWYISDSQRQNLAFAFN